MGITQSRQIDDIYIAAKSGNIKKLEEIWNSQPEHQRLIMLEWKDNNGRTAIIEAACRGHTQVVRQLIQYGADIKYIPAVSIGGGPLHEAVRGKHMEVVQLLLRRGLNPFVENQGEQTPLGYAMNSYNVKMVRLFEKYGIFWGFMLVKARMIVGRSWKLYWCVVVPLYSYPNGDNLQARSLLLVYKDQYSYEPRVKVWLDYASVVLVDSDTDFARALLRLQIGHRVPQNVHVEGDPSEGVRMFFKSYDHQEESKNVIRRFADCVNQNWLLRYPHPYTPNSVQPETFPALNEQNLPEIPIGVSEIQSTPREVDVLRTTSSRSIPDYDLPASPTIHHANIQSIDGSSESLNILQHTGEQNDAQNVSSNPLPQVQEEQHEQQEQPTTSAFVLQAEAISLEQEQPTTSTSVLQAEAISLKQQVEQQRHEDEQLCIVCMAEPKTVGFAHGETMHRCVCLECSKRFEIGNPCPICKQPIQLILKKVFD